MRPLLIAALATLLAAGPALAEPTARVTGGNAGIRDWPGGPIVGRIPEGTEVTLDYCTRNDRWCLVTGLGWVNASYLVGWSAKIRATPPHFLVNPEWERFP